MGAFALSLSKGLLRCQWCVILEKAVKENKLSDHKMKTMPWPNTLDSVAFARRTENFVPAPGLALVIMTTPLVSLSFTVTFVLFVVLLPLNHISD